MYFYTQFMGNSIVTRTSGYTLINEFNKKKNCKQVACCVICSIFIITFSLLSLNFYFDNRDTKAQ